MTTSSTSPTRIAIAGAGLIGQAHIAALAQRPEAKRAELASHARAAGLELKATGGLHYEPFSGRTRLTHDVAVNYIAHLMAPGSAA